jgi:exonuclease-1
MGIQGLLTFLEDYFEDSHISIFRNKTIGIDAYAWLHNALFKLPNDFMFNENYNFIISYFNDKINLLHRNGVTPYFIFDGNYLPIKSQEEKTRQE